ncbi:DUF4426 domain-containing protein [Vibrio sp.]|nr:DUF4426 domain-containing protein [Vibrio sp.]
MLRLSKRIGILITTFLFPAFVLAGQFKEVKDIEVHYSAFNSTFLTPTVAKHYQLTRSGRSSLINISILDKSKLGKPATTANVSGYAKNLIGQIKELNFQEIKEENAIYYIAEFSISNEERLTFYLDVDAGVIGSGKMQFQQTFYVEE